VRIFGQLEDQLTYKLSNKDYANRVIAEKHEQMMVTISEIGKAKKKRPGSHIWRLTIGIQINSCVFVHLGMYARIYKRIGYTKSQTSSLENDPFNDPNYLSNIMSDKINVVTKSRMKNVKLHKHKRKGNH
jgi:hypothetical protein